MNTSRFPQVMITTTLLIAGALGFPHAAWAQSADRPGVQLSVSPHLSSPPATSPAFDTRRPLQPDRSTTTAYLLATGTTLGGVALGIGMVAVAARTNSSAAAWTGLVLLDLSLAIGPSAGHFYAGELGHGAITSAIRAATGAGSIAFLFLWGFTALTNDEDGLSPGGAGYGVGAIGLGLVTVGLAIYDMIDAGGAVRRRIARQRARQRRGLSSLRVAPLIARSATSGDTYGVSAAMRF